MPPMPLSLDMAVGKAEVLKYVSVGKFVDEAKAVSWLSSLFEPVPVAGGRFDRPL